MGKFLPRSRRAVFFRVDTIDFGFSSVDGLEVQRVSQQEEDVLICSSDSPQNVQRSQLPDQSYGKLTFVAFQPLDDELDFDLAIVGMCDALASSLICFAVETQFLMSIDGLNR